MRRSNVCSLWSALPAGDDKAAARALVDPFALVGMPIRR